MNSWGGRIANRRMAQSLVRRLQLLSLRNCATASTSSTPTTASESTAAPEIQIPLRKERSPTDILMALEKTIKRDPTAPEYKYMDDPYLIPLSNMSKRQSALSKESGRKAAMWILKEHADLFQHKLAEPEIPAFVPKAVYTSKDQVSEELLMKVIQQGSVDDSVTIYKLLGDASVECKQALLELLCFYNSEEQLPDDLNEERYYRKAIKRHRNVWRPNSVIDELFAFLKEQDKPIATAAYNALISGTAKYFKVDVAWELIKECEEKRIPLNLETYNHIIETVSFMREGPEERKALLVEVCQNMEAAGIQPNIGTLNASLKVISTVRNRSIAQKLARFFFTKFHNLGIEPSLASYYYALVIFCKDDGPRSNILIEILDNLEGKTLTMQDVNDTYFFVTAMDVATNHLQNGTIAQRLHELLTTGDNYKFIGEGLKESIYYRHYMVVTLWTRPIQEFIAFYDTLVPNIYIPEPSVIDAILTALQQANGSLVREFLPRLWSQLTMFDQLERENLTSTSLDLMVKHCSPESDSPVNQQFAEAAWGLWTHIQGNNAIRQRPIPWSATTLADVALLCMRGGEFERFLEVLIFMKQKQASINGTADIKQLKAMFAGCLEKGCAPGALDIVEYCVGWGFEESVIMGKRLRDTILLTAGEEEQLFKLVGSTPSKTSDSSEE